MPPLKSNIIGQIQGMNLALILTTPERVKILQHPRRCNSKKGTYHGCNHAIGMELDASGINYSIVCIRFTNYERGCCR